MSLRHVPVDALPALRSGDEGLTAAQVKAQRAYGFNDIVAHAAGGWLVVARDTVRDPMLWFLLLTAGLFGALGQVTESVTLLVAIAPLLGMTPTCIDARAPPPRGWRAGWRAPHGCCATAGGKRSPSRELAAGDLAEVTPGEYFPADGLLMSGSGLQVDESTLTGKSLPVTKTAIDPAAPLPASAAGEHWGTAGMRLLTGLARLRVACIGSDTRYGEIVRSTTEGSHAATPLQQAIATLVSVLLGVALTMCAVLAAVRFWQGHGWIDALLSAVTLAVAALPEEFPVVYPFFLGVGVFRALRVPRSPIATPMSAKRSAGTSCGSPSPTCCWCTCRSWSARPRSR